MSVWFNPLRPNDAYVRQNIERVTTVDAYMRHDV